VKSSKEDAMTFFTWIYDNYRVGRKGKLGSVHEYWRIWQMLYRRCISRTLHAKIAGDITDIWLILRTEESG